MLKSRMAYFIFALATIICIFCFFKLYQENRIWHEIRKEFHEYDNGNLSSENGYLLITKLTDFLDKNPKTKSKKILDLSSYFSIYEIKKYRILEYIENPQYYGSSAKSIYHIIVTDNAATTILPKDTYKIERVIEYKNKIYVFGYDFIVTNHYGIFVVTLNQTDFKVKNAIININLQDYYFNDLTLYAKNDSIKFTSIEGAAFKLSQVNDSKKIITFNNVNGYYEPYVD